jgi:hypothetical protein
MRIFIITLLIISVFAITTGDTTIPVNSSTFSDSRMSLYFYVDSTNLTVLIRYKAYAYFSLLYGNSMSEVYIY